MPAPSADRTPRRHADLCFDDLVLAYLDCRRNKRNSHNALAFEVAVEGNLRDLYDELAEGRYRPGSSTCFAITRPKPREVWAAQFRDRIVHHLLYSRIASRFHASFIADSCACIPGRGTLYAAERLEAKVRSVTQNWSRRARYIKADLANFFLTIDKRILWRLIAEKVTEPWWRDLAALILWHDPRESYVLHGNPAPLERVPAHKRLTGQPAHLGLPIGNLSSQFFANIYLNELDQFVKHRLGMRYYIRYVDDFVLLHESARSLNEALAAIEDFLPARLGVRINPKKTVRQPVDRGIDFVGQVIRPWRRTTRKRTRNDALQRTREIDDAKLYRTANSYFGLFRQASHGHQDRARLGRVLLARGRCVDGEMTKTSHRRHPIPQLAEAPVP